MGGEQGIDLGAQRAAAGAHVVQKGGALAGFALESSSDDLLNFLPLTWILHAYLPSSAGRAMPWRRSIHVWRWRNAESFGRFFGGQAGEEAKLDKVALLLVDFGKQLERVIQSHYIGVRHLRHLDRGIEFDPMVRSAFRRAAVSRVVHENLAHEPCSDADKMRAVFCLKGTATDQAQIDFVDEGCGL